MKTETKHTPLPWNIFIVNHNGWSIDDRDTKPFLPLYRIGDADTEVTAQEAIATGQYMERACNRHEAFVEACEKALAMWDGMVMPGGSIDVLEALKAALDKAKGQL